MKITSLPAGSGDCFVIEWGNTRRIMIIDGGRAGCFTKHLKPYLEQLAGEGIKQIELAVATHIDEDHMQGLIQLVKESDTLPVSLNEIWFNGLPQLPSDGAQILSVKQGEELSKLLSDGAIPWNSQFNGDAVMVPDDGEFPVFNMVDGMTVTVLSPGLNEMLELSKKWNQEVGSNILFIETLAASKKKPPAQTPLQIDVWSQTEWVRADVGATNLSSITCLLEHDGKLALFTGDADPVLVLSAWQRLQAKRKNLKNRRLDFLKLNHHGSRKNCSPELIAALKPKVVLVSSDGSIYGHPEKEALSYVIQNSPGVELVFNHDNEYTSPWVDNAEQDKWGYSAYAGNSFGVEVEL